MADQKRTTTGAAEGLAYGLLIGWATGMLWWASLVVIFGLEPAVVAVITDSTGRHETQVTVWDRFALVPLRAIPWAVIAGVVGAIIGSGRRESASGERRKTGRRVATGLAYGLLVGSVVGVLSYTSLGIAFGPGGDLYEHGGVIRVEHFYPILERLAGMQGMAVPWAVVGAVVGVIIGWLGGWLEAITSSLGMIGGICFVLSTSLFDGWLALTMPFYAFVGTWIGLAVGLLVRLVILRPILRRTAASSPP